MHVRYISNRFRSSSGSSFSVNAVESTISQKRTVSCRRSAPCGSACSIAVVSAGDNSRGREIASSGVPHSPQNLKGGFRNPQFAQSLCCIRDFHPPRCVQGIRTWLEERKDGRLGPHPSSLPLFPSSPSSIPVYFLNWFRYSSNSASRGSSSYASW